MDEKIFQRIIPVIIAVVVLIVQYVIRNQKKKINANSSSTTNPDFEKIILEKEKVKPVFERVHASKKGNLVNVVTEIEPIENTLDSKKITYQTVKQTMKQNMKQNIKPSININLPEAAVKSSVTFTEEELKKAIIYSEILTPKHF